MVYDRKDVYPEYGGQQTTAIQCLWIKVRRNQLKQVGII